MKRNKITVEEVQRRLQGLSNTATPQFKDGGEVNMPSLISGRLVTGVDEMRNEVNAEVEAKEFIQFPDRTVSEVAGKRHTEGGEKMNLPEGTRILSDNIRVGKEIRDMIKTLFEVTVNPKDSFAKALNKVNLSLGIEGIELEMETFLDKIKKNEETQDEDTRRVNEQYLADKLYELQQEMKQAEAVKNQAFDILFERQEFVKVNPENDSRIRKPVEQPTAEDIAMEDVSVNLNPRMANQMEQREEQIKSGEAPPPQDAPTVGGTGPEESVEAPMNPPVGNTGEAPIPVMYEQPLQANVQNIAEGAEMAQIQMEDGGTISVYANGGEFYMEDADVGKLQGMIGDANVQDYVQDEVFGIYADGGGIPQRYKNKGFRKVGAKKRAPKGAKHKWEVLARKKTGGKTKYKIVKGGFRGMQDFKSHKSSKRRKRFWDRMGGKNSAKAKDPFSPLYWHKRFGTWEDGGEVGAAPKYQGTLYDYGFVEIGADNRPSNNYITAPFLQPDKFYLVVELKNGVAKRNENGRFQVLGQVQTGLDEAGQNVVIQNSAGVGPDEPFNVPGVSADSPLTVYNENVTNVSRQYPATNPYSMEAFTPKEFPTIRKSQLTGGDDGTFTYVDNNGDVYQVRENEDGTSQYFRTLPGVSYGGDNIDKGFFKPGMYNVLTESGEVDKNLIGNMDAYTNFMRKTFEIIERVEQAENMGVPYNSTITVGGFSDPMVVSPDLMTKIGGTTSDQANVRLAQLRADESIQIIKNELEERGIDASRINFVSEATGQRLGGEGAAGGQEFGTETPGGSQQDRGLSAQVDIEFLGEEGQGLIEDDPTVPSTPMMPYVPASTFSPPVPFLGVPDLYEADAYQGPPAIDSRLQARIPQRKVDPNFAPITRAFNRSIDTASRGIGSALGAVTAAGLSALGDAYGKEQQRADTVTQQLARQADTLNFQADQYNAKASAADISNFGKLATTAMDLTRADLRTRQGQQQMNERAEQSERMNIGVAQALSPNYRFNPITGQVEFTNALNPFNAMFPKNNAAMMFASQGQPTINEEAVKQYLLTQGLGTLTV